MRIFLASPSDVAHYREATKRVADRLNDERNARLGSPTFLELVDWNRHVAPHQDLPESAVIEELSVAPDDLFLGLAWLGFDSAAGEGAASTERNFELAVRCWRQIRPEHCLLYRCMRFPAKLTDIDGRAFDRVNRFFGRFALGEKTPVAYSEFDSATDLEEQLASRLGEVLKRLEASAAKAAKAAPARKPARPAPAAATPSGGFAQRMQPGKAYEVTFLSIEIVDSEQIAAADRAGVDTLYRSFRELARSTAASYGGEIFSWNGSGGVLIFWSGRSYDHAIMTGLKVLHNLPVFNLDPSQNPLTLGIRTRASAHDAVIIFQQPVDKITSDDLDFVVALQRESTEAGELSITRRLLERVDERLRPRFKFKGRFQGEPYHACRLPSSELDAERADSAEVEDKLKREAARAREVLSQPAAAIDLAALETVAAALDEAYAVLNKYCAGASQIDSDRPPEFFANLAASTRRLRREEIEVWQLLRRSYVAGNFPAGKARRLEAIVRSVSRRRSRPAVMLEKLEERCRTLAGASSEPPPAVDGGAELARRVDALLRADVLDVETALTELLLNHKAALLETISGGARDERRRKLLDKLWQTLDLVLIDDLHSIRGRQRADEAKIFDALSGREVEDGRFRIVRDLLASDQMPTVDQVRARFARDAVEPAEEDLQILWRAVVIGHQDAGMRRTAALRLGPDSMWHAIAHPSVPMTSLRAIGERVNKIDGDDAKKIFFDSVRAPLEQAVESFRTREEVSDLTELILLLLDFPFLVETGYFERFDDILRKFLERAHKAGLKVEYFESLRRTLEEARLSADKSPSKPPAGIKKLPLTIQRRLAGESRYVYWFVTHPDPRIASETLRHVGLMNVERVLRLAEVNSAVLGALLKRPELFTRSGPLVAALNHPKCTQIFANRYLSTMGRSRQGRKELERIVRNPSANATVRATARRFLSSTARHAANR